MIFEATRSSRLARRSGVVGRFSPSSEERKAEGHTTSPVRRLTICEPSTPGMTITGRFPSRAFAPAKMRARSGVRRAPQPVEEMMNAE
jgi:hypothetical protein